MKKELKRLHKYLQGTWDPLRVQIARAILQYPLQEDNTRGYDYNSAKIAAECNTSNTTVTRMQYALLAGAVPPTDEEIAIAKEAGIDIPINPKYLPEILGGMPEPKVESPIEKPAEPLKTAPKEAEPPAKKGEIPAAEISKIQMQAGVNQFLENIETGKALPESVREEKKNGDQKAEEIKPALPENKLWHQKSLEAKPTEAKAEVKEAAKDEAKPVDKRLIVGGGLFENVQKVKLNLNTIIMYYYNMNTYGFEGTLDDFLNWCVADCAKSRGVNIEIVENPNGLIEAGQ